MYAKLIHSKSLPDSQKNIRSGVEVSAKFVLAEVKIAQENVGSGSATFLFHNQKVVIGLQNLLQGTLICLYTPRAVYDQILEA